MCVFNAKDMPWYPHQPNFLYLLVLKWHIDPKKIDFGQVKFLVYNIRLPYSIYYPIAKLRISTPAEPMTKLSCRIGHLTMFRVKPNNLRRTGWGNSASFDWCADYKLVCCIFIFIWITGVKEPWRSIRKYHRTKNWSTNRTAFGFIISGVYFF